MARLFRNSENPGAYYATHAAALVTAYPLTFACWFRLQVASITQELMAIRESSSSYQSLWLSATGNTPVAVSRSTGSAVAATASAGPSDTNWHHAGAVYASATSRAAYYEGANKGTNTSSMAFPSSPTRTDIARANDSLGFSGYIAHAAIWSAALDDAEMAALGKGFSPLLIRPGSLVAYWPLMGKSAPPTTELDRWRSKFDLSVVNTEHFDAGGAPRIIVPTRARYGYGIMPPAVPVYTSPADGATDQLDGLDLEWEPAARALSYDVYFGDTNPPPLVESGNTSRTYTPTLVNDGSTYYWQIVANGGSADTPGPVWSFSTMAPPATPSGNHPANGASLVPGSTALTWFRDPNVEYYKVYSGNTNPPPLVADNYPYGYYPNPDIEESTTHYWRVEAFNAAGSSLGPLWSFTIAPGPVFLSGKRIETCLGIGFRARLIHESFNAATWPLAEQARLQARDVGGYNYHGVWTGSGFTGGIPFDVPEGAIGTNFNGNGFVEITDPGVDATGTDSNLSLSGGDIDEAILIKDYVLDNVKRALIAKHDDARATGNGWYIAVQSGAIEFSLIVAGATIFRFSRGDLDDGEHLITAHYRTVTSAPDPVTREAYLTLDGEILTPKVSLGASVDPGVTAAPVRVGHFCDGAAEDGAGIKASLAYGSIGREGDPLMASALQGQREWTDLTEHVRAAMPLQIRYGISGNGPHDNVATTGTMQLVLDNGHRAEIGYYTPGHPLVRSGWGLGVPVRAVFEFGGLEYIAFHGRLATVHPIAGYQGSRHVDCMITDWIDVAAGTPLSALPAQLNKASDFVAKAVLDQAQGRVPVSTSIEAGSGTWPFAIDEGQSERETLLTELSRVMTSERGFAYIRGDTTRGGQLRIESHATRVGLPTLYQFDNTMAGLEVEYGLGALMNIVRVTYTPRRVDSSTVTLYSLDISQRSEPLALGETRIFEGGYVDPTDESERVGGTQMVALVAGTDWKVTQNADGSGADLTSYVVLTQTLGGNSYRLEFKNIHPTLAGYFRISATAGFQVRGKGIYHYKPITIERRDPESVRNRGPRLLEIDLPYESSGTVATSLAEFYLEVYGTEQPIPSLLSLAGNRNATMMRACLGLEPGDKIGLGEPMTGLIIASARFIIHEKRLTYTEPGIVQAAFTLAPAPASLTLRRKLGAQGAAS